MKQYSVAPVHFYFQYDDVSYGRNPANFSSQFDDENKENIPPLTSEVFSRRRNPVSSSSAAKKESYAAVSTKQNLAGPPLKLLVRTWPIPGSI